MSETSKLIYEVEVNIVVTLWEGSPGPIPRGEFWDTGNVLFLLLDVDGVVGWVNPSGCIHGYLSVCSGCTFMYIGYNSG